MAIALSWGFAKGVPHIMDTSFAGAIVVTVPVILFLLGVAAAFGISWFKLVPEGECRAFLAIAIWLICFLIAGLCSIIGGILIFVAAANPPPEKVYQRNNYIAFAALAGIFAVIAGITYCCGMCGFCSMVSDEENESSPRLRDYE